MTCLLLPRWKYGCQSCHFGVTKSNISWCWLLRPFFYRETELEVPLLLDRFDFFLSLSHTENRKVLRVMVHCAFSCQAFLPLCFNYSCFSLPLSLALSFSSFKWFDVGFPIGFQAWTIGFPLLSLSRFFAKIYWFIWELFAQGICPWILEWQTVFETLSGHLTPYATDEGNRALSSNLLYLSRKFETRNIQSQTGKRVCSPFRTGPAL